MISSSGLAAAPGVQGVRVELREGQRQGAAGARRKDKGQSQARKKAVRPPRPPALPVLLLRLAPLVRLEVREVAVTAPVLDDSRQVNTVGGRRARGGREDVVVLA